MVENNQRKLADRIEEANRRNEELARCSNMQRQTLHQLSGLSQEEATRRLLDRLDSELQREAGSLIIKHEKKMQRICEEKSREMLITALQRYAAAHTAETTTSTVDIPSDEMKGRIIGREGRNIRAFEKATGVDVIIDDTPGVVIVSGFDPVRREVARLSLAKLISDGRIHPARIEEVVNEQQKELEQHLQKLAKRRPRRSTSARCTSESSICWAGCDSAPATARTCCGTRRSGLPDRYAGRRDGARRPAGSSLRPVARHRQGSRPRGRRRPSEIGADLLKRYGEKAEVVHAALGHHDDLRIDNPYTVLVAAATLAVLRAPERAARRSNATSSGWKSWKRSPEGSPASNQAFAIQAGRELRVIASAKDTTDATAAKNLSRHCQGPRGAV